MTHRYDKRADLLVHWMRQHCRSKADFVHKGYVLLIILNELGERDTMLGLPSILSLFRNVSRKSVNR